MAELKKGARITGGDRNKLAADLKRKYTSGASIRELAERDGSLVRLRAPDAQRVRGDAARPRRRDPRQEGLTPRAAAAAAVLDERVIDTGTAGDDHAGVLLNVDGAVATVTLARPEQRNAQTPATWRALAADRRRRCSPTTRCASSCCAPRARRSPPVSTARCSAPGSTASPACVGARRAGRTRRWTRRSTASSRRSPGGATSASSASRPCRATRSVRASSWRWPATCG